MVSASAGSPGAVGVPAGPTVATRSASSRGGTGSAMPARLRVLSAQARSNTVIGVAHGTGPPCRRATSSR